MAMTVTAASSNDGAAWDAYVRLNRDASPYHEWVWRDLIGKTLGKETHYLQAQRDGEICGVLPLIRLKSVLFGDFLVSLPYVTYGGILASDDEARDGLLSAAAELGKDLGVKHVELRHTSAVTGWPVRTDKVSMHLELLGNSELLWKQLGAKRRAQIKRPLREGVTCESGGLELVDDFYGVFSRKYRDLGIPVYPQRWFRSVVEALGQSSRVFICRLNDTAVAGSIVVGFRSRLEVPWAASLRSTDRLGVNMYLYWQMLEFAEQAGFSVFDFGRCTSGSGTWRFKKQWGAEEVPLYWHYWMRDSGELPILNADNPKYSSAVSLWRRLPLWMTNSIGPQIVKNLP